MGFFIPFGKLMPILGKGDIGSILKDREGALFFASGTANSSSCEPEPFEREANLLMEQPRDLCLFYFSSFSVYSEPTNCYFIHKRYMESLIRRYFPNYNIIRISNIDWGHNPNTFLNNLRNKIRKGEPVEIRDEYRFLISQEQLRLITDHLPLTGQNEINIFGEMGKVKDLVYARL